MFPVHQIGGDSTDCNATQTTAVHWSIDKILNQKSERLLNGTGKSVSEALILESVNPQYDYILFIDLQLQKNKNSEHGVYINCFECQNKNKKKFLYTTCSELVFFWVRSSKSMNNLLSYFGLTDARMSPSEKDLPVQDAFNIGIEYSNI